MPDLKLPPKVPGTAPELFLDVRSVVVVGANGTGKTRFGAWIERELGVKAHRLTAQRALTIPAFVQPRAFEQAESTLLYGHYDPGLRPEQRAAGKFGHRWGDEPFTRMLTDFEHVLALLFADEAKRNREYSRAALRSLPTALPPKCKLDTLADIWAAVMPQRKLTVYDDKIEAETLGGKKYEARHMSDGERVTVYLMGQALCAPDNSVVIIDEPEIHLHRAIQGLLWDKIEAARADCVFVYITHDLDFAATRASARKVWLKEFDGANWVWEEIPGSDGIPDALLMQVLGSRRPLLFVEGDETSYDSAVYTALYPGELVVARQSCEKVIESTKTFGDLARLHNMRVRGIVDRDRRGEEEVAALRQGGLLVAEVAEVENLFCLPEAMEAVAAQLNCPDISAARVFAERAVLSELGKDLGQQALARALARIQFQLNGFGPKISRSDATKLESELTSYVRGIDVAATVAESRRLLEKVLADNDYRGALRYYNCKGIVSFVARSFGVGRDVYSRLVLTTIKNEPAGVVAGAMRKAIEG